MNLKDILAITDKNASVRIWYKDHDNDRSYSINPLAILTPEHRINTLMDKEVCNIVANKEDDFWIFVK